MLLHASSLCLFTQRDARCTGRAASALRGVDDADVIGADAERRLHQLVRLPALPVSGHSVAESLQAVSGDAGDARRTQSDAHRQDAAEPRKLRRVSAHARAIFSFYLVALLKDSCVYSA